MTHGAVVSSCSWGRRTRAGALAEIHLDQWIGRLSSCRNSQFLQEESAQKGVPPVIHSISGSGEPHQPPSARPSVPPSAPGLAPWLRVTLALNVLYVAFAGYLIEMRAYDPLPALAVSFGFMLVAGVALRLVMPRSSGGWAITLPFVRVGRAILRPWLQPAVQPPASEGGQNGSSGGR